MLICEKEGFDELLEAERIPDRYDLALMSTKGISAQGGRDLAESLGVPCFTLHDLDKNGFVMAAGFPFATDLGIRLDDVEEWGLAARGADAQQPAQDAAQPGRNGATDGRGGVHRQRPARRAEHVHRRRLHQVRRGQAREHGVEKVIPDDETLERGVGRAHHGRGSTV